MTPVQTRANGLVIPPLPQLWLTAVLRLAAELVLHVASILRMCFRRDPVIGTQAMPAILPEEKTDTQQQETTDRRAPARQSTRSVEEAAAHDDPTIIIILGSGPLVRVPRESGDPGPTPTLVPHCSCSLTAEQAAMPALDPRLREGHGRMSSRKISAPA